MYQEALRSKCDVFFDITDVLRGNGTIKLIYIFNLKANIYINVKEYRRGNQKWTI